MIAGMATATVKAVDGMGKSTQAAQQQASEQDASDHLDAQLVQIQKLSALKDQGVLTEEEFQAKKRQILGI